MNNEKFNIILNEYLEKNRQMAFDYNEYMPPKIKAAIQDLTYTRFSKDIEQVSSEQKFLARTKKKLYKKLLKAQTAVNKKEKSDYWIESILATYADRNLLEELIAKAVNYLYVQELFVPVRLYKAINNDDFLFEFTLYLCDKYGLEISFPQPEDDVATSENTDDVTQAEIKPQEGQGQGTTQDKANAETADTGQTTGSAQQIDSVSQPDHHVEDPLKYDTVSEEKTKEFDFYRHGGKKGGVSTLSKKKETL